MIVLIIQGLLVAAAIVFGAAWWGRYKGTGDLLKTDIPSLATGAGTNFFDTLGIGSFAPTTAIIKFFKLTSDENIPGTLNVGHTPPVIVQALFFIAVVKVDVALLVACISAAVAGALIGARVVSKLPVRAIRAGMGIALLIAAGLFAARNLELMPGGGEALALSGAPFFIAAGLHFVFGALMTLGVGLYAPSLITLSLFGMDPRAAFPIMMGACAFLMPAASLNFLKAGRLSPKVAVGLALGGVPAVLVAALIVKEMPVDALRWLVTAVVLIAAVMMLLSAAKPEPARTAAAD
jgi:uncharacterized membrane protein YfcA